MDDLVSRLQTWTGDTGTDLSELMDEAANEIGRRELAWRLLQKALGKLIFAARYTNISPDAIKEAEAALNLASGESPTSQAIHGESRPARD